MSELRETPLHDWHVRQGGRMVDFAGWHMPVQYSGVVDEHHAVRRRAGLFDVSHMGEIRLRGPRALANVQRLTVNDASTIVPGQAQYTVELQGLARVKISRVKYPAIFGLSSGNDGYIVP